MGYAREGIIAGLCKAVASNYLNNVGKGKKIVAPVVFQGGVSKNVCEEHPFDFAAADFDFKTREAECSKCSNHCEIICVYREGELIDAWGNRCDRGAVSPGRAR